jgi:hypothetical protein
MLLTACGTTAVAVKSQPDPSLLSRGLCLFPSIPSPIPKPSDNQIAVFITELNAYAECVEARFDALAGFITAK